MLDSNAFDAWNMKDGEAILIPVEIKKDKYGVDWDFPSDFRENPKYWLVIGNINENPELLNK